MGKKKKKKSCWASQDFTARSAVKHCVDATSACLHGTMLRGRIHQSDKVMLLS